MNSSKKRENDNSTTFMCPNSSKRAKNVGVSIPKVSKSTTHPPLLCPITHELMVDPVLAEDGFVYERNTIVEWMLTKSTSPSIPTKRMSKTFLVPVRKIRENIEALVEAGVIESELSGPWKERKREAKFSKAKLLFKEGFIIDAAKLGWSKAQRILSHWYFCGTNGLEKDYNKCEQFARTAAKGGDMEAQRLMGYFYSVGLPGVIRRKKSLAIFWYEQASRQGCSTSMNNIGIIYGELGDTFLQKSFCWHRKSAIAGRKAAMVIVGKLTYEGKGVPKNLQIARMWFEKAVGVEVRSDIYFLYVNYLLGKMMISGEGGPKDVIGGNLRIRYSVSKGLSCAENFTKTKLQTHNM